MTISGSGQKRTCAVHMPMSALCQEADILHRGKPRRFHRLKQAEP